jgi:hypothetical protein
MLTIDISGRMIVRAHDALALGYQMLDANGFARELPGARFAFTISGPGVGTALGTSADAVTALSTPRQLSNGFTHIMRHPAHVGPALAGLVDLEWAFTRLWRDEDEPVDRGPLSIEHAAAAVGAQRPDQSGSAVYLIIDRRAE